LIIKHSNFVTGSGVKEDFFSVVSRAPGADFASEITGLLQQYDKALSQYDCSEASEVVLRFHLSDVTNQFAILQKVLAGRQSFISVIGQSPAKCCRVALEAWHSSPVKKHFTPATLQVKSANYTALWHHLPENHAAGSFDQTAVEFEELKNMLANCNANVKDHTVRTWLYCRDVDNNYAGLVKARNQFFAANDLTCNTHFIASTGIEGQSAAVDRLVQMDSINYPALQPGQMQYLYALDMLSPTALYGVSFERGTRLIFGDRSHYYISGTASIDRHGQVVHPGNVLLQTRRMLENIQALLNEGNAALSDIKSATLYLRDPADADAVEAIIAEKLGFDLPLVTLKAPVCRPAWLVEMECIAVNNKGNEKFPPLA